MGSIEDGPSARDRDVKAPPGTIEATPGPEDLKELVLAHPATPAHQQVPDYPLRYAPLPAGIIELTAVAGDREATEQREIELRRLGALPPRRVRFDLTAFECPPGKLLESRESLRRATVGVVVSRPRANRCGFLGGLCHRDPDRSGDLRRASMDALYAH